MAVLILNVLYGNQQLYEKIKINKNVLLSLRIVLSIVLSGVAVTVCEGGIPIIPFVLIVYIFHNKPKVRNFALIILSLCLFMMSFRIYSGDVAFTVEMMLLNGDWLLITVLPFIHLYNGERGKNTKFNKYFFYVFYPAHIWAIELIAYFITKVSA